MEIHVDVSSFQPAASSVMVGRIWLSMGNSDFPERGWFDFPAIVLGWWITEVRRAISANGGEVWLDFMESAHRVRIRKDGHSSIATLLNFDGEESDEHDLDLEESLASMLVAARQVLDAAQVAQYRGSDISRLSVLMDE